MLLSAGSFIRSAHPRLLEAEQDARSPRHTTPGATAAGSRQLRHVDSRGTANEGKHSQVTVHPAGRSLAAHVTIRFLRLPCSSTCTALARACSWCQQLLCSLQASHCRHGNCRQSHTPGCNALSHAAPCFVCCCVQMIWRRRCCLNLKQMKHLPSHRFLSHQSRPPSHQALCQRQRQQGPLARLGPCHLC